MNPRNKALIVGAGVGALLGALGGWFVSQPAEPAEEEGEQQAPAKPISPGDVIKLITSTLVVLKQLADLRQRA